MRDPHTNALSAALRTLSSPIQAFFSLRSGEDSYELFTYMLIGRLHSAAGNRLTASLRKGSVVAGTKSQLKSREWSAAGESNGGSDTNVH